MNFQGKHRQQIKYSKQKKFDFLREIQANGHKVNGSQL